MTALLQRQPQHAAEGHGEPQEEVLPQWSDRELRAVQRQLVRLGLYTGRVDAIAGPRTKAGLVEAFGSDEWRTMAPDEIVERLQHAQPPEGGRRGEHRLRYGEMFKDGVLDMTLGIGFDEEGNNIATVEGFRRVLTQHGFHDDVTVARRIYEQAGRELPDAPFGTFFVRENALTFTPPAGEPRQVHAVVRLVASPDGSQGGDASHAFREGMVQSDVSYYSGHGRYGSGPDFDRNISLQFRDDETGELRQEHDYPQLKDDLINSRHRQSRDPWREFLRRERERDVVVELRNEGNVFLNPEDVHSGEFGAKLMYWALTRKNGGVPPVTGRQGELAAGAQEHPERQYRLLVFDGCRTRDYVRQIRPNRQGGGTPGFDERSTDILETRRTVNWGDEIETLAAFLDDVLGQQSAEQIVGDMDRLQSPEERGGRWGHAYEASGLGDNSVVR